MDLFEAHAARNGCCDYRVEGEYFGGAELKGKRSSQEDRMIAELFEVTIARALTELTLEQRTQILNHTFARLNIKINEDKRNFERKGSTAVVALVLPESQEVITASLGDSQVFAVTINAAGRVKCVDELNECHSPVNPKEKQRLQAFASEKGIRYKEMVVNNRLKTPLSTLAVSRAFGDKAYLESGLSTQPTVKSAQIVSEEGDRTFIVTACDGLTEGKKVTLNTIGHLVRRNRDTNPGQIAQRLAQTAFQKGSGDNITVQVSEMGKQTRPYLLGVFDGHGGDEVAALLKKHFTNQFKVCLQELVPALGDIVQAEEALDSAPPTPILTLEDEGLASTAHEAPAPTEIAQALMRLAESQKGSGESLDTSKHNDVEMPAKPSHRAESLPAFSEFKKRRRKDKAPRKALSDIQSAKGKAVIRL